jgi:hypothetical protein
METVQYACDCSLPINNNVSLNYRKLSKKWTTNLQNINILYKTTEYKFKYLKASK